MSVEAGHDPSAHYWQGMTVPGGDQPSSQLAAFLPFFSLIVSAAAAGGAQVAPHNMS